ncbi:lipase [Burkholderia pseudomallei]|nr:lipase [Burkholderia pseudomallei]
MATELDPPDSFDPFDSIDSYDLFDSLDERQTNFTLSCAMDWGQNIKNPTTDILGKLIIGYLGKSTKTKNNRFSIVWGPAVYVDPLSGYAANVTAIFKNTSNDKDYRLAFSGTNPNSEFADIVIEDNDVKNLTPFSKYVSDCPPDALIANGTAKALDVTLQTLPSNSSASLTDFLKNLPKGSTLTVTGHSLGGVLASTFALYFSQSSGYPFKNVFCHSFAAATAGNVAFAAYSDGSLTGKMKRLWHRYDVIPSSWNLSTMNRIKYIYEPNLFPTEDFIRKIRKIVYYFSNKHIYYAQPGSLDHSQQFELEGAYHSGFKVFTDEAGWQHTFGYLAPLSLTADDLNEGQPWQPSLGTLA